jgi:hypothetical protein
METENIKQLLNLYFDGQTSLSEERLLHDYFRRRRVAEELKPYRPMFRYFDTERAGNSRPPFTLAAVIWTAIATAACLLLIFKLNFGNDPGPAVTPAAYIDGQKCTDIETIGSAVICSIDAISDFQP